MTKKKTIVVPPVQLDLAPLKRFLNKQQNLKTVVAIADLFEIQTRLEKTRILPDNDLTLTFHVSKDRPIDVPQSLIFKMRDQCILTIIDEIDQKFLDLKENL